MIHWPHLDLALGILLTTSFTCAGLLALWAATSPWHWLARSAVVLAVLFPLLLIPACEPWIAFALQVCVVVAGVNVWRRRSARSQGEGRRKFRFSLRTLLEVVPFVAILAAISARIAANLPPPTVGTWATIGLNGMCGGCTVLLGTWVFVSRRKRAALALCLALAAIMAWFDWLFVCVTYTKHWPPVRVTPLMLGPFSSIHYPAWAWFAILPVVMAMTWLAIRLWFAGEACLPGRRGAWPIVAPYVLGLLCLALAFPPTLIVWKLLHPQPTLKITIPEPNGMDDIVAAGKAFSRSRILRKLDEPRSTEELASEIAKHAAAYEQLRIGLGQDIKSYASAQDGDLTAGVVWWSKNHQPVRFSAYALMRESELARQQNRYGDAARIALENIRLGKAIADNGLLADYRFGNSIGEVGKRSLHQALCGLDAVECREMIAALVEIERRRESIDDVVCRDRIWGEHVDGWFGRLCLVLGDVTSTADMGEHYLLQAHIQSVTRLLIAELALRAYRLEHGSLPDRLEQLTPKLPDAVLVDPHDPGGRPFRFVRTGDKYIVYSVGADRKDDNGQPLDRDEFGRPLNYGDGDLWLDTLFAPDDRVSNGDSSGQ